MYEEKGNNDISRSRALLSVQIVMLIPNSVFEFQSGNHRSGRHIYIFVILESNSWGNKVVFGPVQRFEA